MNDTAVVDEDDSVVISVLSNDVAVATSSLIGISDPEVGSVSITPSGDLLFTPAPNLTGAVEFDYFVMPHDATSFLKGVVSVTIIPDDDPPEAGNIAITSNEDNVVDWTPIVSDIDTNIEFLKCSITSNDIAQGLAEISGDCSQGRFRPVEDWFGFSEVAYTVFDESGNSAIGTVVIAVKPVLDLPRETPLTITTNVNEPIEWVPNVMHPDRLPLTCHTIGSSEQGGFVELHSECESASYQPALGFDGQDEIIFTATDTEGGTIDVSVLVQVISVNKPPEVVSQVIRILEDEITDWSPIILDDGPANELTCTNKGNSVKGGAWTLSENCRTGSYIPPPNFHGIDNFSFEVNDSESLKSTGLIQFLISEVNDAPKIGTYSLITNEDVSLSWSPIEKLTDPDNDKLSCDTGSISMNGGVVTITEDCMSGEYHPPDNYAGLDQFTFSVRDDRDGEATATVKVSVSAVNDAPIIELQELIGDEDTLLVWEPVFSDIDSDTFVCEILEPAQFAGEVHLDSDCSRGTYRPAPDFQWIDRFSYRVMDAEGASSIGLVNVVVQPSDDPPIAIIKLSDSQVTSGQLVRLDGSSSYDIDGDQLTFEWGEIRNGNTTILIEGETSPHASFVAPSASTTPILLTIGLMIEAGGDSSFATAIIHVIPPELITIIDRDVRPSDGDRTSTSILLIVGMAIGSLALGGIGLFSGWYLKSIPAGINSRDLAESKRQLDRRRRELLQKDDHIEELDGRLKNARKSEEVLQGQVQDQADRIRLLGTPLVRPHKPEIKPPLPSTDPIPDSPAPIPEPNTTPVLARPPSTGFIKLGTSQEFMNALFGKSGADRPIEVDGMFYVRASRLPTRSITLDSIVDPDQRPEQLLYRRHGAEILNVQRKIDQVHRDEQNRRIVGIGAYLKLVSAIALDRLEEELSDAAADPIRDWRDVVQIYQNILRGCRRILIAIENDREYQDKIASRTIGASIENWEASVARGLLNDAFDLGRLSLSSRPHTVNLPADIHPAIARVVTAPLDELWRGWQTSRAGAAAWQLLRDTLEAFADYTFGRPK